MKNRQLRRALLVPSLLFACLDPSAAAVKESADDRIVIESVVMAERTPQETYRLLVKPERWWDGAHTYSGAAKNLRLDARAGGCFCEKSGRGSIEHGRVIYADPGKLLRMDAALGPLQEMAVTAILTFKLEPDGGGTRITMIYRIAGGLPMKGSQLAPVIDQVMTGQLKRLAEVAAADDKR
jgi:uncharacterized protein YndB with AHSA1/START domain